MKLLDVIWTNPQHSCALTTYIAFKHFEEEHRVAYMEVSDEELYSNSSHILWRDCAYSSELYEQGVKILQSLFDTLASPTHILVPKQKSYPIFFFYGISDEKRGLVWCVAPAVWENNVPEALGPKFKISKRREDDSDEMLG